MIVEINHIALKDRGQIQGRSVLQFMTCLTFEFIIGKKWRQYVLDYPPLESQEPKIREVYLLFRRYIPCTNNLPIASAYV